MEPQKIAELIEIYSHGGNKIRQAIMHLTRDDLLMVPIPGKWSTQTVVLHVADAEAALADRIRRVIAMDDPVLLAWDENKFAERLMYDEQSADDAVAMIDLTRRQLSRLLHRLPLDAFERFGRHSERGRQTLLDLVNFSISHLDHHLKFIYEKREKMGKTMW